MILKSGSGNDKARIKTPPSERKSKLRVWQKPSESMGGKEEKNGRGWWGKMKKKSGKEGGPAF